MGRPDTPRPTTAPGWPAASHNRPWAASPTFRWARSVSTAGRSVIRIGLVVYLVDIDLTYPSRTSHSAAQSPRSRAPTGVLCALAASRGQHPGGIEAGDDLAASTGWDGSGASGAAGLNVDKPHPNTASTSRLCCHAGCGHSRLLTIGTTVIGVREASASHSRPVA